MKKKAESILSCVKSLFPLMLLFVSCTSPENKAPEGAYASSSEHTTEMKAKTARPARELPAEEEAYHPLLWEIKWSSRRVFDFGKNYEKICKTEFINPYKKVIKEISIGYEVNNGNQEEVTRIKKTIELNLQPGQRKVVDTGVGCNDFFMFAVVFADGSTL